MLLEDTDGAGVVRSVYLDRPFDFAARCIGKFGSGDVVFGQENKDLVGLFFGEAMLDGDSTTDHKESQQQAQEHECAGAIVSNLHQIKSPIGSMLVRPRGRALCMGVDQHSERVVVSGFVRSEATGAALFGSGIDSTRSQG